MSCTCQDNFSVPNTNNCTVKMFYFRFVVDPDVLVWVHAIDLHSEVLEVSSHLGKMLVHIGWVDFKTLKN